MNEQDRDMVIRTVIGESDDQPPEGQAAVAHVIMNRLAAGKYGKTASDVVLARNQFEPWSTRARELVNIDPSSKRYQRTAAIVDGVLSGDTEDPTQGSTHFLAPDIMRQRGKGLPQWAQGEPTAVIGGHSFWAPEGRVNRGGAAGAINSAIGQDASPVTSALAFDKNTAIPLPNTTPATKTASSDEDLLKLYTSGEKGATTATPTVSDEDLLSRYTKPSATTATTTSNPTADAAWAKHQADVAAAEQENVRLYGNPQGIPAAGSEAEKRDQAQYGVNNGPGRRNALTEYATGLWPEIKSEANKANESGNALWTSGLQDTKGGNYLPTMGSLDPTQWTAGGYLKTAGGMLASKLSAVTGGVNALVTNPIDRTTGVPGTGDRLLMAGPGGLAALKTAAKAADLLPSNRAVNALVEKIGAENVPAAIERMRGNALLSPMDVSHSTRVMAQGMAAGTESGPKEIIAQAAKRRANDAPRVVDSAYTEAMGPAPDTVKMVQGLQQKAQEVGRNIIQPALETAKPVDTSKVVAAIDAELKPGVQAVTNPGLGTTPTALQQELAGFRKKLTDENGSTIVDPVRLHQVQSELRQRAYQLSTSATGSDRLLGHDLYDFRNRLVDAIDDATKTGDPIPRQFKNVNLNTPSGKTDRTGVWFLDGDKPIYSTSSEKAARDLLGSKAGELSQYESITGKNANGSPIQVWYKPGERARAEKEVELFSKGYPSDVAGQIRYHVEGGEALGYPKHAVDSYVRSRFGDAEVDKISKRVDGPYKEGLQKFRDAKQIDESFDAGFDTLKNRPGRAGLEDRPEAFAEWMKNATPEEVVARRLGTRADIDQKINASKTAARAASDVPRIEYNRQKLRMLFGEQEANRLIRAMDDVRDMAQTNSKILEGSKTAETTAALGELKPRDVGKVSQGWAGLLSPALGEIAAFQAGLSGWPSAAMVGLGLARKGAQKAGQISDKAKNLSLANALSATGPAREALINQLAHHPDVLRAAAPQGIGLANKFSNALASPILRSLPQ